MTLRPLGAWPRRVSKSCRLSTWISCSFFAGKGIAEIEMAHGLAAQIEQKHVPRGVAFALLIAIIMDGCFMEMAVA